MKTLYSSLKITVTFAVILFCGYVLVLWGFASLVSPNCGEAEVVTSQGRIVGAANVGQQFTSDVYFHSRPSAVDYNGRASGGSNKGPSDKEYLEEVNRRTEAFLKDHPYLVRSQVPSEMVTASASGLDPDISVEAARVQVRRVALARGISEEEIREMVQENTNTPIIGVPTINVLKLNIALDENKRN